MKQARMRTIMAALLMVATLLVGTVWAQSSTAININTATVDELTTLNRIGVAIAERIVAHREANGPFNQAEDLMNVKGVGQKVFELNEDRIIVEEEKRG
ncbi:MAG: helix-hairpin-helix domain-containing protein [Desulfobacterales bacterium]|jgi:competence protein ComEA